MSTGGSATEIQFPTHPQALSGATKSIGRSMRQWSATELSMSRSSLHEAQGGSVAVIVFTLMTDRAHDHLLAHCFKKYDVAGRSKWHDEFP